MIRFLKFFFLMQFFCLTCFAQKSNADYLEGKVPVVEGKVVFSKNFNFPGRTQEQVYDTFQKWIETQFSESESSIVYSDRTKGDIAVTGKEYLVFSNTGLALDRSMMNFRLIINCKDALASMTVSGIRYDYNVSYQKNPERYLAEEWITDEYALNKNKLNRFSGKFRKATIDYVNDLFKSVSPLLPAYSSYATSVEPEKQDLPLFDNSSRPRVIRESRAQEVSVLPFQGYRNVSPDRIPGNIIKMLGEDWMLITAGDSTKFNMMTASWGGLGRLFEKAVSFSFINPKRYTFSLMENTETYTLSFYTEAYRDALQYAGSNSGRDADKVKGSGLTPIIMPSGAMAFNEAWMIIECRKLVSQPLTPEVITDPEEKVKWDGKQVNQLFIGEIINVWIK